MYSCILIFFCQTFNLHDTLNLGGLGVLIPPNPVSVWCRLSYEITHKMTLNCTFIRPGTGSDSRCLKTKAWYLVRSCVLSHNELSVCVVSSSDDEMAAGCVRLPCRSAVPRCILDCESNSDLTWTYLNIWFRPQRRLRLHEVCWWPGPAPRNTAPWCTEPPRPQCCPAVPTWSVRDTNHQSCRSDQRDNTQINSLNMLCFHFKYKN